MPSMVSNLSSNPKVQDGGKPETQVSDDSVQSILQNILKEMKKMNLQMAFMTDNLIKNTEVEGV